VRPLRPVRPFLPALAGRWSALAPTTTDTTTYWTQAVTIEIGRHAIVTRGAVLAEPMTGSYMPAYKVLSALEARDIVRRGFFVEGAGASQFALPGVVDRLRAAPGDDVVVLAACDPANPYGAAVDWPATLGHRPARRAGAVVVLRAGRPLCYLERGARTLLVFEGVDDDALLAGLTAIGAGVDESRFSPVTITRVDHQSVLVDAPRAALLRRAGFAPTPQGYIRRPT